MLDALACAGLELHEGTAAGEAQLKRLRQQAEKTERFTREQAEREERAPLAEHVDTTHVEEQLVARL
jgi:hypothetical protein